MTYEANDLKLRKRHTKPNIQFICFCSICIVYLKFLHTFSTHIHSSVLQKLWWTCLEFFLQKNTHKMAIHTVLCQQKRKLDFTGHLSWLNVYCLLNVFNLCCLLWQEFECCGWCELWCYKSIQSITILW